MIPSNADSIWDTPGMRSAVTPILTKCPRKNRIRSGTMVIVNNKRNGLSICPQFSCFCNAEKPSLIDFRVRANTLPLVRMALSINVNVSLEFCKLNTTADKPVMIGLIIPMIKPGIFPIQANSGRAC